MRPGSSWADIVRSGRAPSGKRIGGHVRSKMPAGAHRDLLTFVRPHTRSTLVVVNAASETRRASLHRCGARPGGSEAARRQEPLGQPPRPGESGKDLGRRFGLRCIVEIVGNWEIVESWDHEPEPGCDRSSATSFKLHDRDSWTEVQVTSEYAGDPGSIRLPSARQVARASPQRAPRRRTRQQSGSLRAVSRCLRSSS